MDKKVFEIIKVNSQLCLNIDDPGWADARGYVFDQDTKTIFFPVSKVYLDAQELDSFRVLIMGSPRIVVSGRLEVGAISSEEAEFILQQKIEQGIKPEDAKYTVYDQRTKQPRKNGCKLRIESVEIRD